jgi:AAA15 family ATPase/GTPase
MTSLQSITIHQFRGLRDLSLDNLGRINLLVGINNSGKTSVLEALTIYCHPLDIRTWISTARQRDQESRIIRTSSLDALQWLFTRNAPLNDEKKNQKREILISSSGSFIVKELRASYTEVEGIWLSERRNQRDFIRQEEAIESDEILENDEVSGVRKGIDLKIEVYTHTAQLNLFDEKSPPGETPTFTQNFQLWEDEFLSNLSGRREPSLSTTIVTPASHRSQTNQLRLLSEARFQNFKSDVVKLLQQMDKNISDIEILVSPESTFSRFNIYIQHNKLGLAPISTFGDGVRRLLHIALKLVSVKGGIILIDELESTIHTELLQNSFKWLVKWCVEMDIQLFATTHSLEAVDALLEASQLNSEANLVLYRLEPKESKTRVIRHNWDRLRRLREELGQEVRW